MSMTREEARIEIQSLKDTFEELEPGGTRTQFALKIALSALRPVSRERVEKAWKGEWIKRHKHRGGFRRVKGIDDMGEQHEVTIDERCEYDDLYCSKCGKQSPDNFLNFCGYCGAPMTDEAVDMVMERMEKMKYIGIPNEFEDIFRGVELSGVELSEDEIRTLNWIIGWDRQTVENLRSVIQKAQAIALSTLQAENEKLRAELCRELDAAKEAVQDVKDTL